MISNPKHGWCNFDMGDFHGTPSYLTNVPVDLLSAFIDYYENNKGLVTLDEEGSFFTLVLTENMLVYIISEKEEPQLYSFDNLSIHDLAKELVSNIMVDLDEWSYFDASCFYEDDIKRNKEHILDLANKLNSYIERE